MEIPSGWMGHSTRVTILDWRKVKCQWLLPTMGEIFALQAGQPPASKVLYRYGLPSSLGVWGLGYADKQIVASLPGKKTYLSQRKINKKRTALKLGYSNVHTMTTELDGLPKISDVRTHSSAPMPHPWPPYLRQKTYLNDTIKNIHSSDHLVLLGDFNARVGADHESWSSCLCCFGVGKINENGGAGWALLLSWALPTPICRRSHNTECHGATLDPSTNIGSTWSLLDVQF